MGSKGPAPVALGRPPFDNGTRRTADRPVYASRYPSHARRDSRAKRGNDTHPEGRDKQSAGSVHG
jgi:hypothetical protein